MLSGVDYGYVAYSGWAFYIKSSALNKFFFLFYQGTHSIMFNNF